MFVAGAIIPESLPFGTEWRMRLVGLNHLLPKLSHEGPLKPFSMKQFREYYIPIYKNLICRYESCVVQCTPMATRGPPTNGPLSHSYSVETTDEILATVELTTSRRNVAFRLSILDQGKEVLSKTGIGQVIIPMFRFLASKGESTAGSMVVKLS